jgi:hypothetical protein
MKLIRLFTGIVIVSLLLINSSVSQVQASGIGVSSSPIVVNDAVRGESYYRTLTIHNIDDNDTVVLLSAIGEIKEWVTFNDYSNDSIAFDTITIPGKDSKQVLVNITIPEQLADAKYNGTIIVTEQPREENISFTNASQLIFSYPLKVDVEVTGVQNLNITIDSVYIEDNEAGYPIITTIRILNNGNVIARPKIYEKITKNNIPVEELSDTSGKIQPGGSNFYGLAWNTSGMVPGQYVANINIVLHGVTQLSKNITFNLLKVGELKRDGYLSNITVYGDLAKGKNITIYGIFVNTGFIELKAQYVTKVFNNDRLIDTIETTERQILKGKSFNFVIEYTFPTNGTYLLENYVVYSDVNGYTQTNSSFIELHVGATNPLAFLNLLSPLFLALMGITVICVFCIVLYTLKKRKSRIVHNKNVVTKKVNSENSPPLVLNNTNNNRYVLPNLRIREDAFASDTTENSTLVLSDSSPSLNSVDKAIDKTIRKSKSKHKITFKEMKPESRDEHE